MTTTWSPVRDGRSLPLRPWPITTVAFAAASIRHEAPAITGRRSEDRPACLGAFMKRISQATVRNRRSQTAVCPGAGRHSSKIGCEWLHACSRRDTCLLFHRAKASSIRSTRTRNHTRVAAIINPDFPVAASPLSTTAAQRALDDGCGRDLARDIAVSLLVGPIFRWKTLLDDHFMRRGLDLPPFYYQFVNRHHYWRKY